ncbi:hypothetical protein G7046_g4334 [Stylonectria norvegica]|nr:hypothetical protein G7046_g4334 [Stylonectria norvegica]
MSLHNLEANPSNGGRDNASLLSPMGYDDDASSLHSRSDQDTDSEDDELISRARNSRELRAHDRIVLMEEEELDRLVTDTRKKQERVRRGSALAVPNPLKIFGRRPSISQNSSATESTENLIIEKRKKRRTRRQQKRKELVEHAQHGEDGELMYEMEEGGLKEGSSTGESSDRDDSDEVDRRQLNMIANAKSDRRRSWRRWVFIHTLIAIGFAILILISWKLSKNRRSGKVEPKNLISNGTALFAPTTLIISLDGFRADFLQRGLTPTLDKFVAQGVSPKWMNPSFPSVTFPNHYTIATGLYPESHGVVGNTFWDPELKSEFFYTDPNRSLDPKWWGGEPFWVTAERQKVRTAVHMWPGSEAHVLHTEPSIMDKFNAKELLDNKVARILEFLDMPGMEDVTASVDDMRPQLIAAYVPNVDSDGHRYGPNSTEIRTTIESVDTMMGRIFHGLEERNLTNIVNVIVVSDHGMATTDISRLLQLEDLVDTSKIEHTDGWPLYGLRPKNPDDLQELYDGLLEKSKSNPNFEVYLRDVNMPERYHFSKNDRIAPLWIVPKTGWAIVKHDEFSVKEGIEKGLVYHPRGLHGYDHEHPLMRAIFIARGPAFPHAANSQINVFREFCKSRGCGSFTDQRTENIEVYNMLCDSVGIEPVANNGTLRLPLKPIGLHDPDETPETPEDPEPSSAGQDSGPSQAAEQSQEAKPSKEVESSKKPERPVIPEKPTQPGRPTVPEIVSQPTRPAAPEKPSALTQPKKATTSSEPAQTTKPNMSTSLSHPTTHQQLSESAGLAAPSANSGGSEKDETKEGVDGFWDWLTGKVTKVWHKIKGTVGALPYRLTYPAETAVSPASSLFLRLAASVSTSQPILCRASPLTDASRCCCCCVLACALSTKMAEDMDIAGLTEELTIQQVILDSLQNVDFPGADVEREEAINEMERLKKYLRALKQKQAAGEPHAPTIADDQAASGPSTNPGSSAQPAEAMSTPPRAGAIWSQPGSHSLPSRKRNLDSTNLQAPSGQSKSRRTTPSRLVEDPFLPSSAFSIRSRNDIDVIDLTGDDEEYVKEQIKAEKMSQQEVADAQYARLLSSQEEVQPGPSARQGPNAFSRIMASQLPGGSSLDEMDEDSKVTSDFTRDVEPNIGRDIEPNITHDVKPIFPRDTRPSSTRGETRPHWAAMSSELPTARMPGAYDANWDDPFNSRPAPPRTPAENSIARSYGHASTTPGSPSRMQNYGSVGGSGAHVYGSPSSTPVQNPGVRPVVYGSPGFPSIGNGTGPPNPSPNVLGMPSWMPGGQGPSSLSNIINRTNAYDYASGLDVYGNPLPERVTDFLQDAFHDPRVTEEDLDNLLENIRPDMDIPEMNRDGTPAGLRRPLYPHQELALAWMKKMEAGTNKGGILADDMGLGKTISTLALMLSRPATTRPKTNLIVGPVALIRQWEEEIMTKTKLSHRMSVFVYHSRKTSTEELLKYDVVLTTYGTIAAELTRLEKFMEEHADRNIDLHEKQLSIKCPLLHPRKAKFYRIILDEAQCIKNKDTRTAKACAKLKATYRWCLTGTPMMNSVAFGVLFGRNGDSQSVAMSRLRVLLKAVMLRRKKNSLLDGKPILKLPEKTESIVYAELSTEEHDFYDQLEKKSQVQFSKYLRAGSIGKNYSNILVLLLRLRQACCHPHLNLDVDDVVTAVTDQEKLELVKALDPAIVERIKGIEAFECPICYDVVPSPAFFIPCGHDSCNECLCRLTENAATLNLQEGSESTRAKCPVCRGPFDPSKCFTYEAFKTVHMPETIKEAELEDEPEDDMSSDGDDSDSDSEIDSDEEVDSQGNLKGFIINDGDVSDDKSSEKSHVLKRKKKKKGTKKGKKKASDIKPSMLKTLRKEAYKNHAAFKKYMRYLRQTWMPAAKVSECMKLLTEIQPTGEKIIIFSQWTLLLDLLEVAMWHEKFDKPVRYDGSMSATARHIAAHKFRDEKNVKVMLVSLRAGNAGLNLTAASRVIIMDPFWNPYIEMQAVDRAYRIGQQKEVKVYRILTKDTVEDRIVALQEKKKEIVESALDEAESVKIGRLNVSELKFLFNAR